MMNLFLLMLKEHYHLSQSSVDFAVTAVTDMIELTELTV